MALPIQRRSTPAVRRPLARAALTSARTSLVAFSGVTVFAGSQVVGSAGTAIGTTISNGGTEVVSSGGKASGAADPGMVPTRSAVTSRKFGGSSCVQLATSCTKGRWITFLSFFLKALLVGLIRGTSVTLPRRKGPVTGPQPCLPVRLGFPFWPSAAGTGTAEGSNSGRFDYRTKFLVKFWLVAVTGPCSIVPLAPFCVSGHHSGEKNRTTSNVRRPLSTGLSPNSFDNSFSALTWDSKNRCSSSGGISLPLGTFS
jgi:autotransporter passenger strand-loop-strand repeat protein